MDADRFDTLAKRLVAPTNRRSALGAAVAGGFFSALGIGRAAPATRAAQGGTCVMAFAAQVLQGPSVQQTLTPAGARPGEVRGDLSFSLSATGNLENATLALPNGTNLPVVGQAIGYSLHLRIELAPRTALVAVGVGEQEIARCQGAIDGVAAGPQVGDLGDWHAAGVQQARGGGGGNQGTGTNAAQSGNDRSGNRANQSSGGGNASGGASNASTGGSAGSNAPSCPPGETFCDYAQECRNLSNGPSDCGACGSRCSSLLCENGRCLSEEEADARVNSALQCAPDETICDGRCVYLPTDPRHCGACGNACDFNVASCQNGECVVRPGKSCVYGQLCGATCVDTTSDPANCGACGIACLAGDVCRGSLCVPAEGGGGCKTGFTPCGTTCVDVNIDPAHCGACGFACAAGEVCSGAQCGTVGGGGCKDGNLTYCGENVGCVDVNIDPANCGSCGVACAFVESCQGGACVALPVADPNLVADDPPPPTCADQGLADCGGVCVDPNSDPFNCGGCGVACGDVACLSGVCQP